MKCCKHNLISTRRVHQEIGLQAEVTAILVSFLVITGSVAFFLPPAGANLAGIMTPSTADASRSPLWNSTWGGPGSECFTGVVVDGLGDAYVAGYSSSWNNPSQDNIWVGKYSASGLLLWNTTWGGLSTDHAHGIALDASGNAYVVGFTASWTTGSNDIWLGKFSSSGSLLWNTTWGGSGDDQGLAVIVDAAGNPYISGYTTIGSSQALIAKYDSESTLLWYTTWGGPSSESANGIALDGVGHIYACGDTYGWFTESYDVWLGKFDCGTGRLLGNTTYGDSEGQVAWGIDIDNSGNVYLAGQTTSAGIGLEDFWIGKFTSEGALIWNWSWGSTGRDVARAIAVDRDGTVHVCGWTQNWSYGTQDGWYARFNAEGDLTGSQIWGGFKTEGFFDIAIGCNGITYLAGFTNSWGAGGPEGIILAWNMGSTPWCVQWWETSFLGLPVWGWLVIAGEALVLVVVVLLVRRKTPKTR